MRLFYAKDPRGNFGDDLNEILWDKFLPNLLDSDPDHLFIGIGTILNDRIPDVARKTVFGAGFGYGAPPRLLQGRWDFHVVRGPITAKVLDLPEEAAVTDPGALIGHLFPNATGRKTARVAFMPHHVTDQNADWAAVCEQAGLHYISPRDTIQNVAEAIAGSDRLLTEAMHGAIAADAFRVPWKAVEIFDGFNPQKWTDWCLSMGLSYSPTRVTHLWGLERLQPPGRRIRNRVKRLLHLNPLWRSEWYPPLPQDSDDQTRRSVVQELKAAADSKGFLTSEASVLNDRLEELVKRLARLREMQSR